MQKHKSLTKFIVSVPIVLSLALITACSSTPQNQTQQQPEIQPVKLTVDFSTNPTQLKTGEASKLSARLSKNGQPVPDAKVSIETWKDGIEKHDMTEALSDNQGTYSIQKTFTYSGSYHAVIHINTSDSHQMATKDFQVAGESAQAPVSNDASHADHHGSTLEVQFLLADQLRANVQTSLTAKLLNDHQPLTSADVHIEYWKDGDAKHTYEGVMEKEAGVYRLETAFPAAGEYNVVVHVVKGELHDHKQYRVKVE